MDQLIHWLAQLLGVSPRFYRLNDNEVVAAYWPGQARRWLEQTCGVEAEECEEVSPDLEFYDGEDPRTSPVTTARADAAQRIRHGERVPFYVCAQDY